MHDDPIVEEVRRHREHHAEEFGFDLGAICRDLRRQQRESNREVVSFASRRPEPVATRRG
jgi:hypothetical protein